MKIQLINSLIRETLDEQTYFKQSVYGWRSDVNQNNDDSQFPRVFFPASPDGTINYKSKSGSMNVRLIFEDLQGMDNSGAEVVKELGEYWDDLLNNGIEFIQNLNTKFKQNSMGIENVSDMRFDTNSNVANTRLVIAYFDFVVFFKLDCI